MAAVATIGRHTGPASRRIEGSLEGPVERSRPGRRVARRPGRPSATTFRRRRIAVAILVVVGIVGTARAAVALGGPSLAAPEPPPAVTTFVVEPGDSLWTVAEQIAPGSDPRPIVDTLAKARGDEPLIPGERITWGR